VIGGVGETLSVLQVLEKGNFNTGSVVQMYQLARGLAGRGHRVAIVTRPEGEAPQRAREDGLEVVSLPLRGSFDLESARALARLYEERRVDIVHAHKGISHAVALAATFFSRRRPLLVANRGVTFPLDLLNRWKYHVRLAAVVSVCEEVKRVVVASGRVAPEKVHVVYAGVDPARFDPARADGARVRREWGLASGEKVILQVSVREEKGWRELLAATAMLAREQPRVRTVLVACPEGPVRDRVLAHARALGVAERVLAVGFRSDMPDVLAAADVVVDLSWGGLGITGTLREAMAVGRPVIASSAGGNPELVEDGRSGLLVPPRDAAAFAAAARRLFSDPDLARRLARAGRERVLAGFTAQARLDRIEELYGRLIGAAARPEARAAATG
jgi:glycosyltransferase involved in cell wall biosynthesis